MATLPDCTMRAFVHVVGQVGECLRLGTEAHYDEPGKTVAVECRLESPPLFLAQGGRQHVRANFRLAEFNASAFLLEDGKVVVQIDEKVFELPGACSEEVKRAFAWTALVKWAHVELSPVSSDSRVHLEPRDYCAALLESVGMVGLLEQLGGCDYQRLAQFLTAESPEHWSVDAYAAAFRAHPSELPLFQRHLLEARFPGLSCFDNMTLWHRHAVPSQSFNALLMRLIHASNVASLQAFASQLNGTPVTVDVAAAVPPLNSCFQTWKENELCDDCTSEPPASESSDQDYCEETSSSEEEEEEEEDASDSLPNYIGEEEEEEIVANDGGYADDDDDDDEEEAAAGSDAELSDAAEPPGEKAKEATVNLGPSIPESAALAKGAERPGKKAKVDDDGGQDPFNINDGEVSDPFSEFVDIAALDEEPSNAQDHVSGNAPQKTKKKQKKTRKRGRKTSKEPGKAVMSSDDKPQKGSDWKAGKIVESLHDNQVRRAFLELHGDSFVGFDSDGIVRRENVSDFKYCRRDNALTDAFTICSLKPGELVLVDGIVDVIREQCSPVVGCEMGCVLANYGFCGVSRLKLVERERTFPDESLVVAYGHTVGHVHGHLLVTSGEHPSFEVHFSGGKLKMPVSALEPLSEDRVCKQPLRVIVSFMNLKHPQWQETLVAMEKEINEFSAEPIVPFNVESHMAEIHQSKYDDEHCWRLPSCMRSSKKVHDYYRHQCVVYAAHIFESESLKTDAMFQVYWDTELHGKDDGNTRVTLKTLMLYKGSSVVKFWRSYGKDLLAKAPALMMLSSQCLENNRNLLLDAFELLQFDGTNADRCVSLAKSDCLEKNGHLLLNSFKDIQFTGPNAAASSLDLPIADLNTLQYDDKTNADDADLDQYDYLPDFL